MSEPTARQRLFWLKPWDWSEEDMTIHLDAYRDEVALDMGRDLLRDGLDAFLRRLVGAENALRLLASVRIEDAATVRGTKLRTELTYDDRRVNRALERAAVAIEAGSPLTVTTDGEPCPRTGCRIRSAHAHGRGQA